ncbi:LysR family transcriptional regulator, partial [Delftia sp. BR1]
LAVGSIMAASPGRLTQALLALKRQWPLLSIEVAVDTSDRLLAQLQDGVLEVVVGRPAGPSDADHRFCSLDDEALSIIAGCGHPLARARSVGFAQLQAHGWVLQPPGSPMRALIDQEFQAHGLPLPRGLIETGSILTTMNLVRNSDLVAVIPQAVARDHAEHGMVRILPYRMRRNLQSYGSLVRRDRPLSQAAASFLALLHGQEPPPASAP